MHWFKIHHGYSSDAKLALAAHKLQTPRATINGIFVELLEYASKQEERGSLVGYNIEAGALAMGVSDEFMRNVIVTLRNVTLVTDEKVVNWDRYQGGGDRTAAERQRRHRDKKKQDVEEMSRDSNVTSPLRNVDKSREDKSREDKSRINREDREILVKMPFKDFPQNWQIWTLKNTTLSHERMTDTWLDFHEYWTIGRGKNTKRADWFRSWKKWCEKYLKPSQFAKPQKELKGDVV